MKRQCITQQELDEIMDIKARAPIPELLMIVEEINEEIKSRCKDIKCADCGKLLNESCYAERGVFYESTKNNINQA